MTLLNPKCELRRIRDFILVCLRNNKETLNAGLSLGVFQRDTEQIKAGDYLPLASKNILYPTILVKLVEKTEEFKNIGNAGRKRPQLTFKIIGIVKNVLNAQRETDNDILQLCTNIEAVFRNNIQLGDDSIVLWAQPVRAVFDTTEVIDNQYFDIVLIDLECVSEVK